MADKNRLKQYDSVRYAAKAEETAFVQQNADAPEFLDWWANHHLETKEKIEANLEALGEDAPGTDQRYRRIAELTGRLSCYD
jgi:hypothetical protein